MKKRLNPTLVYVLSIVGLLCCCFGGLGFILSGSGFLVANNSLKNAQLNPEDYEAGPKQYNQMKTAKTVALIITIINVIYLLVTIYRIYTVGWDEIQEQFRQAMEQYEAQQAAQ